MLSNKDKIALRKINNLLKESYNQKTLIDENLSEAKLDEIEKIASNVKTKVIANENFNSYHKNKHYNKALLILEAVKIVKGYKTTDSLLENVRKESTMKNKPSLQDLKETYKQYVAKNGENKKSKLLKEKISKLESKIYENGLSEKLGLLLKEDAEKAETIMTAKGLLDDIIGYQSKIGELQNKYLDPFVEMVKTEYNDDLGNKVQEELSSALQELMDKVRDTKTKFSDVVSVLSGEKENLDDGSMGEEDSDNDENNDLDTSDNEDFDMNLDLGDEGEGEGEGKSEEEKPHEEPEEEDFKRRKE